MGKIIGIDLGTTNSAVGVWEGDDFKVIENKVGGRTTPSVIAYTDEGEILVGQEAQRQAVTNPENTFYAIKRLIGRRFDDEQTQKMKDDVPFEIVEGPNGDAWLDVKGEAKPPQAVSAEVLKYLKESAEAYLGEPVTEAVITVPAYFNDSQRQATIDAGKIAGLEVKRIINEPTAAALAFGLKDSEEKKVIVYDLGGGTFDVSVMEVGGGVFEVKAANGDTFLGGEDFDNRIIDWVVEEFQKETGFDLRSDKTALARVKEASEDAKKELSRATKFDFNLPFISFDPAKGQPLNLQMTLTRSKLEDLVRDLVERSVGPCEKALEQAGLTMNDIDEVLMVGGMTYMPMVREAVKKTFGDKLNTKVNPVEVVGAGASVQGGILSGDINDILLLDVAPLSLGIEIAGGVFHTMIPANTTIPTKIKETFSTHVDNQSNVMMKIGQGERAKFADNKLLGEFELDGIPPAKAGTPQIEVTYEIDANGVLKVSAVDKATGKEQNITVKADGGLSEAEVEQMKKDAEANKEADEKIRAEIEAFEEAKDLVSDIAEVTKQEWFEGADEEAKTAFNAAAEKLKGDFEAENKAELVNSVAAYKEAKTGLGASFYENAKKEGEAPEDGDTAAPSNDDAAPSQSEGQKPAAPKA